MENIVRVARVLRAHLKETHKAENKADIEYLDEVVSKLEATDFYKALAAEVTPQALPELLEKLAAELVPILLSRVLEELDRRVAAAAEKAVAAAASAAATQKPSAQKRK